MACSKDEYESSWDETLQDYTNSLAGYNGINKTNDKQNSCLKFYNFNYDENNLSFSLLLDHNTTITQSREVDEDNTISVLEKLSLDTQNWSETIIKTRLITANEMAKITENTNWDESSVNQNTWYHFDSLSTTPSETCTTGNASGCNYGWLYDRISDSCKDYGCPNNSDSNIMSGYWVCSSETDDTCNNWYVPSNHITSYYQIMSNSSGIRPVIEVLKENFKKREFSFLNSLLFCPCF